MEHDHAQIPMLEYSCITDGIYIGTNQCCRTHFDEMLKREGITADISLEKNRIDQPFGVDFYLWLPVENHTPPSPDQLILGVSVLETLVQMGRKAYIHCANGHGRAPTLVAAYLIRGGRSPKEAEAFIKSKRPAIHLNNLQRQALETFSRCQS